MFASGLASVEQYFAQLYADPKNDPFSYGRQMSSHFATRFVDDNGNWMDLANRKNISSDIAPTAGQMPRALGLAFASKIFRNNRELRKLDSLSHNGNEICFCPLETPVLPKGISGKPLMQQGYYKCHWLFCLWDDGYGISVPKNYQTTKGSISDALKGLEN